MKEIVIPWNMLLRSFIFMGNQDLCWKKKKKLEVISCTLNKTVKYVWTTVKKQVKHLWSENSSTIPKAKQFFQKIIFSELNFTEVFKFFKSTHTHLKSSSQKKKSLFFMYSIFNYKFAKNSSKFSCKLLALDYFIFQMIKIIYNYGNINIMDLRFCLTF